MSTGTRYFTIDVAGIGRANGQDISIRGYTQKGVLTLVDGLRQGTDTGHLNGVFLDPAYSLLGAPQHGRNAKLFVSYQW
ncbi:hypothetical protein PXH59_04135 [Xenorhabdus sp. SF857]|nr:hypothetical protein [Xenorhabdus sp. SF857]WFQ81604.1 hypothetical protein PXH59_04135 [Xenorhabdus sp. SF857]